MGRDTQAMKAVVGEEALSDEDFLYLNFIEKFEKEFLTQGMYENRDIERTLNIAWDMLDIFPPSLLKKIPEKVINQFKGNIDKVDSGKL
mmetsp:Transcript_563/g.1140  ORF Transcript_563/g.1140 Transcript_563/m.1140 type:complete len:89 (+) Transcript_563:1200-1466(+)|eukprot:CAMPEP_0116914036 /NCGR_PEP_ID=MMETSP0467-20121206/17079_1 /TAXON_ID=283647 /ORGANISM="Mesodinium pulex, Strain SPMC105" /LENGTH=88 /DNA_ID=CAMNT_0004590403 /DNA_START=1200 /DNA_END=1466 /DNA_ORIENTATION=+